MSFRTPVARPAVLPRSVKEWAIATILFAAGYAVIYALMSIPQLPAC